MRNFILFYPSNPLIVNSEGEKKSEEKEVKTKKARAAACCRHERWMPTRSMALSSSGTPWCSGKHHHPEIAAFLPPYPEGMGIYDFDAAGIPQLFKKRMMHCCINLPIAEHIACQHSAD